MYEASKLSLRERVWFPAVLWPQYANVSEQCTNCFAMNHQRITNMIVTGEDKAANSGR